MQAKKNNNSGKNKHLTLNDRISIAEYLAKGLSFKEIARALGKSPSTISREIKRHTYMEANSFTKQPEAVCPQLAAPPFVCNGCPKKSRSSCSLTRHVYISRRAQEEYENLLKDSRSGIPLKKSSFDELDRIISGAVRSGQHIYHITQTYHLPVSISTVYRHIKRGYYSVAPIDLPCMVRFKPRRRRHEDRIPPEVKAGRMFSDYIDYTAENPGLPEIQLDTVIGRIGGKVIMTIHFLSSDFMIGLLLENKTSAEASAKILEFKKRLLENGFSFGEIIPVILTDNGGEFSAISTFENIPDGVPETKMFFCDPYSPYQKPEIEKNHTLFRDIVKAGTSFDDFTQGTVNVIFSHVNSVKRAQFNGKSAYEMFCFTYSEKLATAMGIHRIPPEEVIQSTALLRKLFSE